MPRCIGNRRFMSGALCWRAVGVRILNRIEKFLEKRFDIRFFDFKNFYCSIDVFESVRLGI